MKRCSRAAVALLVGLLLIGILACQREPMRPWQDALQPLPEISLQRREVAVAEQLTTLRARVEAKLANPSLTATEASRVLLELARSYMAYEFDPAARALFENLLQIDPDQRTAHYLLAVLLQREGQLDQAELHLQQALLQAPGDGNSQLRLAEIALARNDLAGADSYFQQAALNSRTELAARAGRGRVALAGGDFQAAQQHLEWVLQQQADANALRHPLAQALRELGQQEAARTQLLAAGDTPLQFEDPLLDALSSLVIGARSLLTRARRAMESADFERAEQLYRSALESDPQFALAEHGLGMALVEQSRFAEAMSAFQRAVDIEPTFTEAWFNLATAALRLQQLELADAAYGQVLALDSSHHEARLRRSAIAQAKNQPETARALLKEILDSDPVHIEALRGLVQGQTDAHTLESAQQRLSSALGSQLDPRRRAEIEILVAELALRGGNRTEAIAAYARALQARPEHGQAWYQMAVVQIAAKDEQGARRTLEEGLQHDPDQREIAALLIELLASSRDTQVRDGSRALELAQQMARRHREPRFIELTAMALAEMGAFQQAAELIQRILEAPQTQQAPEEIRARLEAALHGYRDEQPPRRQ